MLHASFGGYLCLNWLGQRFRTTMGRTVSVSRAAGEVFLPWLKAVIVLGLVLGSISSARAGGQFAYDLSGRLVQAVAPNGSASQYQYDAAGNLLGIQQIAMGTLAITSFAPASGPGGTTVTVSGTGFNLIASQNTVTFGGAAATVVSATTNQLVATVPAAAVTGPIVATNASGTATSATSFVIGSLLGGGNPAVETTFGANSPSTLTFAGNVGDGWTLIVNDINAVGATVTATVTQPGGAVLANCSTSSATLLCTLPTLPVAGSYMVSLVTSAGTATGSVQLVADQAGGLLAPNTAASFAPNGSTPAVSYMFTANTGESDLELGFAADTIPGNTSIVVYNPNGTTLTNTTLTATMGSTQLNLGTVAGGTYRVRVIPGSLNSGSIQTTLVQFASGSTLTIGGPPVAVNLVAGQNGQYTFNGTQGQLLGVGVTNLSTPTQSLSFRITGPGGTQVGNFSTSSATGYALPALPATGSYILTANPGPNMASFNLSLSADQTGLLATSGTPVVWSSSTVGQFGTYNFNATAGQSYVLQLSGDTILGLTNVYVYEPVGSTWSSTTVVSGGSASIALSNTPTSGTYQVRIVPAMGGAGNLTMSLTQPSGGTLTVGAPPAPVSIAVGESAVYSFSGTAGQLLSVAFTDFSTVPAARSVTLTLAGSNGVVMSTCNVNVSQYSRLNGAGCTLPPLPANDSYTLTMGLGMASASFGIQLVADQTGTLTGNPAVTAFASNIVGQSAAYSLAGVAGQDYVVEMTGNSFLGSTNVYVYNPDGGLRISTNISNGGSAQLDLGQVSTTGNYFIRVEPTAWEASADKILIETAGALATGNAALSSNLAAGQVALYTFSGVQGQNFGLGLSTLSLMPSGGNVTVTVTNPDGTRLGSSNMSTSYALPTLPQTGTYAVTVDPGAAAASFNLQLLSDQTGTLVINAAPTIFTSNVVGQNASYAFAGVAGQNYALNFTADSLPGLTFVYVYKPDGTQWTFVLVSSSSGQTQYTLPSVPTTGTYSVPIPLDRTRVTALQE